jgi:hypothetical protein
MHDHENAEMQPADATGRPLASPQNEIASFPELFAGMEQFLEEQAAALKRTSALLAGLGLGAGSLLYYLLQRAF